MAHEDRPNYIDAVVTCEGNLHDPDFSTKFQIIVDKLKSLLSPSKKEDDILRVRKIEPWNSVKVTISIPKEAAERLKQLAEQGSHVLRQLGILSVQVEGDQVISLTLAGSGSEPTHVTLQHGSEQSFPSGSSSAAGNFLVSGISNPSFLQKQTPSTSTVPFAVAGPSGVRYPIDVRNSAAAQPSPFRSPNVVAPTGESVPFSQRGPPGPGIPPRIPLAGPFPFASMVHAAAHTVQRGDTNSVQVASDENSSNVSNQDKVNVGNAYVLGKSANVQNTASQFHNVQQSTPVTGVRLTSQSGVVESGGAKFVFSSNSQSSANNAISQASSLVLPATSSAVQPGTNPSLQIQLVNVNNSTLPPPPYPYQQKQPPATLQIRQQPPQLASQIAASDKPMSSPLLVNLLQHGDTNANNGGLVSNAASPRPQSLSLSKSQVQMFMPPPPTAASSMDGQQQQYFRRQVPAQEQRPQRSLSLDSTNSSQRLEEPNAFHDLNFTASQSLSAITYSTSSPLTNSNEQFQFAMPLPCDVPSSSRNIAEQQLRTSTITQNSSQNSTPYRGMNPTEVAAFHQQQQHNQLRPTIRMQQQQPQGQMGLDHSSYQKMQQQQQFALTPTESVQLQNQQQQARSQQPQHMFNGPVSSPQQYSSPQTIAQSNAPSFVVNTSDNSMMPITSVAITSSGQSQQTFAVPSSPVGVTGSRFYGPTTQANIATAVHVTKIPVQQAQAMSTLTDQQQIHSFIPISAVNVTSVSNPVSNASAMHAAPGNTSQGQGQTSSIPATSSSADSVFAFPQPMPKTDTGKGVQSADATTKNLASHSSKGSNKTALVPSIPTSVTSLRPRGRPPGPRTMPGSAGGGKPRLLLINPLTGHLEPTPQNEGSASSESEDDKNGKAGSKTFTGKRGLGKGKPAEALASGMPSVLGKQQPATISEQAKELQRQIFLLQQQEQLLLQQQHRLHQPSTPSTASAGAASSSSALGGRKLSTEEGKADPLSSSGEKIKLRLKLEKSEPVLSPAYKVNVSFLKTEEKATTSGAASQTSAASVLAANPSSSQPSQGSVTDQPRVPPLHISLRGKNAAVVVSPRRDEREHSDSFELSATPTSVSDAVKPAGIGVNCVDAVVAAVSGVSTNVKNRMKNRLKSADVSPYPSQSKVRTPRPKNTNTPRNVANKSVPGKIRAKKSNSFSSANVKAGLAEEEVDWDSQPKKTKKSRRKSELSETKSAVHANAAENESKLHPEISQHDRLDGLESSLTPRMEESQLLQLLSDNVTADDLSTNKTESTNALTKIPDVKKSDVAQVTSIPAKTEVSTKKSEPGSNPNIDLPPPIQNLAVSVSMDSKKGSDKAQLKGSDNTNTAQPVQKIIHEIPQSATRIVDQKAKDENILIEQLGKAAEGVEMKPKDDKNSVPIGAELKSLKREYSTSQVAAKDQNCEKADSSPPAKLYKPAKKTEIPEIFPELPSQNVTVALSESMHLSIDVDSFQDTKYKSTVKVGDNLDFSAAENQESKLGLGENKLAEISIAEKDIVSEASLPHRTALIEKESKKSQSGSESEGEVTQIAKPQLPIIPNSLSKADVKESKDSAFEEVFKYEESAQETKAPVLPVDELLRKKATPATTTPAAAATSSNHALSRQVPLAVQPMVEPSNGNGNGNGNGHSAGGEDSGIDSMDALSEKSPNQGESPVRKELEHHLVNSDKVHQYLPSSHPNEPGKYYERLRPEPEPVIESGGEPSTLKVNTEEPTLTEIVPEIEPVIEKPTPSVVETKEPTPVGESADVEKESSFSSEESDNRQAVEIQLQSTRNTDEAHTGEKIQKLPEAELEIDSPKEKTDNNAVESDTKLLTVPSLHLEEEQEPEQIIADLPRPKNPEFENETVHEDADQVNEEKPEEPSSLSQNAVETEDELKLEPVLPSEAETSAPMCAEGKSTNDALEDSSLEKDENAGTNVSEPASIQTEDNNTLETETELAEAEMTGLSQVESKAKSDLVEDEVSTKEEKPVACFEQGGEILTSRKTTSEIEEAEVSAAAAPVAKPEPPSPTPNAEPIQETKQVEAPVVVPVEQGIMPPSEIVAMVQNLKEALKEDLAAADSSKDKQKQNEEPTVSALERPTVVEEAPKEGARTIVLTTTTASSTTPLTTEAKVTVTKSTTTNVTEYQPGSIPVSFLPRIEHSAIRHRPLLRPHVQSPAPTILLRPKLMDSTARIALGVRSDLKSLPRLQPKPEDRVNHEPIQVFPVQIQSAEAPDSEAQPNIDLQSLPLSFSRSGGITSLPNVIHLTRAPSGSITTMQGKVPSSLIATSATGGVVSVSLPQVAQAGKTNPPRIFALHSNSGAVLPRQIQQQQQTVTLPSGQKIVPIQIVHFPRNAQGAIGSFVGTPLNRSSPTLIEAVKTSAFRNVSSSSPVHSSPQGISAVQVGVPGSGNITLVPISAVPTNVSTMAGQHNPVKVLVSSPLKAQHNLRQPVVMKSVVMGTPPMTNASVPRGATTFKVLSAGPGAINHCAENKSPSPSPSTVQPPVKKEEMNSEELQRPIQPTKAKTPPEKETEKEPNASAKQQKSSSAQNTQKPGGGASIYKGIHGVQLLETSLPDTKNQDFLFQADIIHDEKDLAAVLAGESICITENGIDNASSSAYDFTHNDYDVLPPQPIKAAIRQATDTKTTSKIEGAEVAAIAITTTTNDEDELEPNLPSATPNSPVRVLRSNSPLYTYSNRGSSARNSDHSRESSRSASPNPEVYDEDQEIIDSFSSSASPKSFDTETDVCPMEKFPDHSYNQKETTPDGNGELGPLSISIPGQDDVSTEEKKGKRSTRSTTTKGPVSPDIVDLTEPRKAAKKVDVVFKNSPKASPTGSIKLLSPTIGGGSGASSARASPISNSASSTASSSTRMIAGRGPNKRRRQESDSSSASKDEITTEDKMELIDLNSRPGKRRCSENAAELIKACIGIEDTPKRVNSFSRKLEDTKARDRIRKNTPTILEQNESETDSIDFSLTGKSASRGSSEDRSSSRGSSVQRSSIKSILRDEDSLDKLIKKKDLPRNKLKAQPQSRSESPIMVADQPEEEPSKARRSKRATPAKSQNALGTKRARNAKEQVQDLSISESSPSTGPKNEKRKTRSSAANRL